MSYSGAAFTSERKPLWAAAGLPLASAAVIGT
jgi:hypothetical protein